MWQTQTTEYVSAEFSEQRKSESGKWEVGRSRDSLLQTSIFLDAINHRGEHKLFSRNLPLAIRAMDNRIATDE